MVQALASLIQAHPYATVYGVLAALFLALLNEIRHGAEKGILKRSLRVPVAAPSPLLPAPTPSTGGGGWGARILALFLLAAAVFAAPLVGQQAGQPASSPIANMLTSGTYRGLGTGPLGSSSFVLELDLISQPQMVKLINPARQITLDFEGSVTPESGGAYLNGSLVNGGLAWGTMNAHATFTQVRGTIGAGPAQWSLDLRR